MKLPKNWPVKKFLISGILAILLLWSLVCQFFFVTDFDKAKTAVARWPQFSKPHLRFALALFQTGAGQAGKELELGKKTLFQNQNLIKAVENIITQPEQIQKQIDFWQSFAQKGIEFPQSYLRLSLLNFKIYQKEEAKKFWEKAFYLDPNNKVVEEVGKIIN